MKALRFNQLGDLAALELKDVPRPSPSAGEALIRIRAAGLNPSDVKNVLGRFPYTTLPRTPGRDFAGTVLAGPSEWLERAVWGSGRELGFSRDGSHAEFMTLPVEALVAKPSSLTFAEAASCGVPYTTAWDVLRRSNVGKETALLVIGGAGAVGQAAVGLGTLLGARVLAAVRKPRDAGLIEAAGTPTIILGDPAALSDSIRPYFPDGPEVIFDTTGSWLDHAIKVLAPFGRIGVIAAPPSGAVNVPVLDLYRRGGCIIGANSLLYDAKTCAGMLAEIGAAFDAGLLRRPAAAHAVAFGDRALASYRDMDQGRTSKTVFLFEGEGDVERDKPRDRRSEDFN